MSEPALLQAGRELTDWLCRGGKPARGSRFTFWLYRWRAFWFEHSYAALLKCGPAAEAFPYQEGEGLVFIQGFWRSGTTLLHELLTELPGCAAPCTWQCMDPPAMLTPYTRPRTNRSMQRPMDQIVISSFSPQEDEFALLAMGCPSVYRGFLDPRRLPELVPLTDPAYWVGEPKEWLTVLRAFLAWCGKPGVNRMILKSPNHVFRTHALVEHFPKARFLWILRDPAAVWRSNRKMWRAMIERYSLWTAAKRELEDFLEAALNAYAGLLEEMHSNGSFLSQPAYSYEVLTSYPAIVLPELLDHLGIEPWSELPAALQASLLAKPHTAAEPREIPADAPASVLYRLREIQEAILCVRQDTFRGS